MKTKATATERSSCVRFLTRLVRIICTFGYIPYKKKTKLVERPFLSLVPIDAWIVTNAERFPEQESHDWNRQKRYADTFGRDMKLAVEQIF